jgi:predicted aspartyl protease
MPGFAKLFLLRLALCIGLHACTFGFVRAHSSVPLRVINGSILVAPVLINGQGPFDFVVDTGTNTTLMDPTLVEKLAIPSAGRKLLATLTGSTVVARYFLNSLVIGNEEINHVEVLSQDLVALRKFDSRIQGILGFDLLRRFSFRIDNANRHLDLYAADELPVTKGGVSVLATVAQDRILVSVANEAAPHGLWNLALDSGVSRVLVFDNRFQPLDSAANALQQNQARNPPQFNSFASTTRVTTNASARLASVVKLDCLTIGKMRLRGQPVVILHSEMSASASEEDGLLPTALFRAVLFDRATSTLIFDPD